jgi:NAD-dependent DNA ligase
MTDVSSLEIYIRKCNVAYAAGTPLVSDETYDQMIARLATLTDNTSPVLNDIGVILPGQQATPLPYWVGSLDKVIGATVTQKMSKCDPQCDLIISDKLDGISCLYVRRGGASTLLTRGNGEVGQNITHMARYIRNLPIDLLANQDIIVRGELVILKKDFETLFSDDFANMRNLVAGCVNSNVPKQKVAEQIIFVAYEIPSHSGQMKLSEQLRLMKTTVTHTIVRASLVTYDSILTTYKDRKTNGEFDIDGIVVAMDITYALESGSNPKHAFAFKDQSMVETKNVEVECVTWDVSRHGRLTPVVSFTPVALAGVMVGKATGHNYNFVHDKGIGVGAIIVICRSGDVIPKIIDVVKTAAVRPPSVPYRVEGPHAFRLEGIDPAKRLHFFLTSLDIKNAGPAACMKLYENGIVYPRDVVSLTPERITSICGTKTGANVPHDLREAVNSAPTWKLLSATSAFGAGIGERILHAVYDSYPGRPMESLDVDELQSVEGVGKSRGVQIITGIQAAMEYLSGLERTEEQPRRQATGRKLDGHRIVFTGVRDKALNKLIEDEGGLIVTGGKKATILVVANNDFKPSVKSNDAIQSGARTLTVERMRELLIN